MIQQILLVAHVLISIGIIAFVLIQRGKGAEAGAAFGAGASGTVFGARGSASFLTRSTAILATGFFATSLALAYFANQPRQDSAGDEVLRALEAEAEASDAGAGSDDLPPVGDDGTDQGGQSDLPDAPVGEEGDGSQR